ncbi:MAG: hypothetical protein ACRD2N_09650 [Vicinamibacterales bacterium]
MASSTSNDATSRWSATAPIETVSGRSLPGVGSDDYKGYFAGFEWIAPAAGTHRLHVTSFEAVSNGELPVARQ